ncbi:2-dehydro-3-deoxygalactonokinase [Polaribacter sp. PL03]|uniref:2-dehydro-3-deoxygalactonokinase n=1 Tax=Polaribacter sp. PL03 TaxID=3088353 RepID=UPI0029D350ED|nr:2-dehydro-3-deoxygalactonokinase [Polaribacter sp. PL03]MDX6747903.1 2-dehydro-3-deoxygalactonokinase [Polaribacter sp. PL03]
MTIPKYFISCDWGTTNFRLRLVETDSLKVLQEHKTKQGVRRVYEKFTLQSEFSQKIFFSNYLKEQLKEFPLEHRKSIIVIAGMASANIGLQELEYADLPINPNKNDLSWKHLLLENGLDVLLISGVKSELGMMRGEEVQAVGLSELLEPYKKGVLLLPGTHSKHIVYENEMFTKLKTYMTGELFEVLSRRSILKNSVSKNTWSEKRKIAFTKGVQSGFDGHLTSNLFSIRAQHIINGAKKKNNYYVLSGMLIGEELSYLKKVNETVFLAASEPMLSMYELALKTILKENQLVKFNANNLEKAFLKGQKNILLQYVK